MGKGKVFLKNYLDGKMATRRPTQRIWYYKGHAYKSEQTFLDNCKVGGGLVAIYDLVEYHPDAHELKTQTIKQRERDEQLEVVLDENSDSSLISKFRTKLIELCPSSFYTRKILYILEKDGLNRKSFEKISKYKDFLLHEVSYEQDWYETLMSIRNFTSLKDHIGWGSSKRITPPEAFENFTKAKQKMKKK